jgi:UDP-glucose 4-epimerase
MPQKAEVEVRPRGEDDAATILLDPSQTEADFDWRISTPLEEGVRRAIDYYREFGIEETYTHLRATAPANEPLSETIGS